MWVTSLGILVVLCRFLRGKQMFLLMLFTDPEVSLFLWAAVATVGEMFHMEPWISKPVLGGGFSFLNEFLFFFLLLINYRGLKFSEVFTVCVATLVKSHKSYYTWQTIDLGKLCQAIWRKKKNLLQSKGYISYQVWFFFWKSKMPASCFNLLTLKIRETQTCSCANLGGNAFIR